MGAGVSGGAACQGERTPGDDHQQSSTGQVHPRTEPRAGVGPDLRPATKCVTHSSVEHPAAQLVERDAPSDGMRYYQLLRAHRPVLDVAAHLKPNENTQKGTRAAYDGTLLQTRVQRCQCDTVLD